MALGHMEQTTRTPNLQEGLFEKVKFRLRPEGYAGIRQKEMTKEAEEQYVRQLRAKRELNKMQRN